MMSWGFSELFELEQSSGFYRDKVFSTVLGIILDQMHITFSSAYWHRYRKFLKQEKWAMFDMVEAQEGLGITAMTLWMSVLSVSPSTLKLKFIQKVHSSTGDVLQ